MNCRRASRPALALLPVLCLLALFAACVRNPAVGGPFPQYAEYAGREVDAVRFAGQLTLPRDSLDAVVVTRASRCRLLFLPICIPGTSVGEDPYLLDLQTLARDVIRLQLYYRDHGYYGTRITVSVEPARRGDDVAVRFAIVPGDEVVLRELVVEGTEEIIAPETILKSLPLEVGKAFRRIGFLAAADTIQSKLFQQGYAYAEVLRNFSLDTIADVAEVQFVAIPGPQVRVDTVVILGASRLNQQTVRQFVTLREGDLLRQSELNRSQRNLYGLEMVSVATVQLAPDSLQVDPDSASATVVVRLVEAPQYAVTAGVGFGTIDCLRTNATWVNRNFLGRARRLEVSGSLSRIGVGDPLDFGLGGSVCKESQSASREVREDEEPRLRTFAELANYTLRVNYRQPTLFNTRNQLGVSVHGERVSEIDAFLRESVGGQVTVARELGSTALLTTTAEVENGLTLADPAVFCIGLNVCDPEDQRLLAEERRWSNVLTVASRREWVRGQAPLPRTRSVTGRVSWASSVLGSDDEFFGGAAEYRQSQPLRRPGWVLAWRFEGGAFLQGDLDPRGSYLPPQRRFFAGGPNTVRGYPVNGLGPTVYVTQEYLDEDGGETVTRRTTPRGSAIGGTRYAVGSLEVRVPSPVLAEFMRLAAFVDAGQVWAPRADNVQTDPIRVTPGVGLRLLTPVGPFRLDLAYNPSGRTSGPLYLQPLNSDSLMLDLTDYQPPDGGFLSRLQVQFGVGQAF